MAFEKSKVSRLSDSGAAVPPFVGFEYCVQFSREPGDAISPSDLSEGELALNSADGTLYFRDAAGSVGQFPSASGFLRIVTLAQAAYDALAVKDAGTLYIVTPGPG